MDVLDYINEHYRFQRYLSVNRLREELGREKGHCTWCNKKMASNYRRWCSDECRTEGNIRSGGSCAAWAVEYRDKGICSLCGLDTLEKHRRVKRIRKRSKRNAHSWRRWLGLPKSIRAWTDHPWECDHIIPVSEGGGCCGIDNLRTLCRDCHREETADLARRRAANKKDAGRPLLNSST